nr:unnamed protein product [Digitaria exilis]
MAGTKLVSLGFIVLVSMGLASAARVARYSTADGTGTGGGGGGGYMVYMQQREGVVGVVEVAKTVGLVTVKGLDQVRGLPHIARELILVMENLPMLVVLVVVEEEDKLEVLGDLVDKGLVVALGLDQAILTGANADGNGGGSGNSQNGGSGGGSGAGAGFGNANP